MSITGAGGGKVQRMRMVSTLRGGIMVAMWRHYSYSTTHIAKKDKIHG